MNKLLPTLLAGAMLTTIAHAAVITENFEGVTIPALPTGWQLAGGGTATIGTTIAEGNPSKSLSASGGTANYLVNSDVSGQFFDLTQDIDITFDFYLIGTVVNYEHIDFWFGDVQDGLTSTSSGEYLQASLIEKTFGTRARLFDGTATQLSANGDNNLEIFGNEWNSATVTWRPTSGLTGDFSISWVRPGPVTEPGITISHTFDTNEGYVGFGSDQNSGYFDNLSITGTLTDTVVVPEASAALLLSFASLALLRRRR